MFRVTKKGSPAQRPPTGLDVDPTQVIRIDSEMRKDLRWWKETAYRFNRHSFPFLVRMKPEINLVVTSDASDIGFGARFGNRWFAYRWLFRETDRFHIAYRDLFAVVCALATWGAEYRGKVVNFWCESSAEERYLEEGHPRATRTISTTPAAKATHRARSDGEAQRRAPRATIALEAKWDHRKRNALARKGKQGPRTSIDDPTTRQPSCNAPATLTAKTDILAPCELGRLSTRSIRLNHRCTPFKSIAKTDSGPNSRLRCLGRPQPRHQNGLDSKDFSRIRVLLSECRPLHKSSLRRILRGLDTLEELKGDRDRKRYPIPTSHTCETSSGNSTD